MTMEAEAGVTAEGRARTTMGCWPILERKWQAGPFQVPERSRPCLHFDWGFQALDLRYNTFLLFESWLLYSVYRKANKIKDARSGWR